MDENLFIKNFRIVFKLRGARLEMLTKAILHIVVKKANEIFDFDDY